MTVLMGEYKSTADYGHAWDQLGENGEVLGRATWAVLDTSELLRSGAFDGFMTCHYICTRARTLDILSFPDQTFPKLELKYATSRESHAKLFSSDAFA